MAQPSKQARTVRPGDHGAHCRIHVRCATKILQQHHNPPRSWGGKRFVFYWLCPNAHEGEVHPAIDELVRHGYILGRYSAAVRAIAYEALREAAKQHLKPKPTL